MSTPLHTPRAEYSLWPPWVHEFLVTVSQTFRVCLSQVRTMLSSMPANQQTFVKNRCSTQSTQWRGLGHRKERDGSHATHWLSKAGQEFWSTSRTITSPRWANTLLTVTANHPDILPNGLLQTLDQLGHPYWHVSNLHASNQGKITDTFNYYPGVQK